jgi:hypothetical protein
MMINKMQLIRGKLPIVLLLFVSSVLLVAVVVVAAPGTGETPKAQQKRRPLTPRQPNAAGRTFALLSGIPQHGSVLGDRRAPVTLQFFGDLQCREARQVMLGALPFLIRHWVRAGKLQIRFRSTETDTSQAGGWFEFREQQSAALAAGRQDKLWNFIDVFYREQGPEFTGYVDDAFLERIALRAGIEIEAWEEARTPPERWTKRLTRDAALAKSTAVVSTPSFLIGPTGGPARPLRHFALEESKVFDEAIEEELRGA